MSGWPCVTSSAVRAVLPVTMALIARVVPWINMLPRPSSSARVEARRVGRHLQAVENADDGVMRRRLRLEHAQAAIVVLDHEVGEGASRVDRKPHPLPLW